MNEFMNEVSVEHVAVKGAASVELYEAIKMAAATMWDVRWIDGVQFLDICQDIAMSVYDTVEGLKAEYLVSKTYPNYGGWFANPGYELNIYSAALHYVDEEFEGIDDEDVNMRCCCIGQVVFMDVIASLVHVRETIQKEAVVNSVIAMAVKRRLNGYEISDSELFEKCIPIHRDLWDSAKKACCDLLLQGDTSIEKERFPSALDLLNADLSRDLPWDRRLGDESRSLFMHILEWVDGYLPKEVCDAPTYKSICDGVFDRAQRLINKLVAEIRREAK